MRLPFIESVERERQVAYVAEVVRRLSEIDVVTVEAGDVDAALLARQVVGVTDMNGLGRKAAISASRALAVRLGRTIGVIGSDLFAPALHGAADAVSRACDRAVQPAPVADESEHASQPPVVGTSSSVIEAPPALVSSTCVSR